MRRVEDWMLWMDSDSYFIGGSSRRLLPRCGGDVEEDFAARMIQEEAIFGYTHVGREEKL